MLILIAILISLLFINFTLFAQQTEGQSLAGTNYLIYTPPDYDPVQNASPLLVTLMGGSEIGDDLNTFLQNNSNRSPAWLIDRGEWPDDYPFVVLTPQLPRDEEIANPNDQSWPTDLIDEVISHIINNYNINEDQIYLTGVSLGAKGCWDYAADYPAKTTAIVPISGPADISTACQLKDIPIWAIHGGNDGLVDPFINATGEMVDSVNNCNGQYKARFDLIPSRGHDIWNDIYPETMGLSIFDWLLNFEKGVTTNAKPYVGLSPNLKLVMPDEFINLYGFAFDVDGNIINYDWEVISPASAEIEIIDDNNIRLLPNEEGIHLIKLTATDNDALSHSDTVEIEIFDEIPGSLNFMTGLMLQDGENNIDLFPLETGDNIINLFNLGTDDINIRAIDDGVCNSFRFAINAYQNIRTENRETVGLLLSRRRNPPEWNVRTGSYTISATPYSGNKNNLGVSGISVIRKLLVFDQEPKTYELIPDSDISLPENWVENTSSENPQTFQENFQNFIINDSAYTTQAILETGVVTNIHLKPGSYLTLNDSLAIPLILDSASTLQINNSTIVDFEEIHPNSNIIYNANGQLNNRDAGNIEVTTSNVLSITEDSLFVSNLLLGEGATIQNNTQSLSITIQNDLTIEGMSDFSPTSPFSIIFDSNKKHQLFYGGTILNFNSIELLGEDTLEFLTEPAIIINLSRINLAENSLLDAGHCNLNISGDNVFSENPTNGKIKLGNKSNLFIDANPAQDVFLNLDEAGNILKDMSFNITGANKIILSDSLKLYGEIDAVNGVISSNGYMQLLATDSMTAYILNNTGSVEGDVQIEKIIPAGRLYRYIGSSALNFTIEDFQQHIPVTGSFTGSSTGNGLGNAPSMFSYDTNSENWIPFPTSTNQEIFEVGKGYAVFFRNENDKAKIKWNGELVQSDFNYTLDGNLNIGDELSGWNLIANPYATPVLWGNIGWNSSGLSNSISIADNSVESGRFLVWDGEVGDVEFSGIISQNQAFWIRSIDETPSLTISEAAKIELGNATTFRKTSASTSGLVITLSNEKFIDRLYYKMNTIGSTEFLPNIDAVKKINGYFNIFYKKDDLMPLAIKNLPNDQCFNSKLGIEGLENGNYSLGFKALLKDSPAGNYLLHDHLIDSLMLIHDNFQYDFSVHSEDSISPKDRFNLKFELDLPLPEITQVDNKLMANYSHNIQWFRDSILIEGATEAILIPDQNGNFYFQVESNSCFLSSPSFHFAVTGNNLHSNGIYIHPNPIKNDNLIIRSFGNEYNSLQISLINIDGKEILKRKEVYLSQNYAELMLTKEIKNGMYFLLIQLKDKIYHKKIIINR
ncbi:T9SS type A sorting domain-containing protein [Marivirga tractuosa]|uniref:PKD domain-containing protein n=1 Tax=Marivirga tractuosa TaxID=1006 RepID=UPI0035D0AE32